MWLHDGSIGGVTNLIYVISDIHGSRRRFDSVMSQIDLKSEDTLYILGDVVDRYPFGVEILRRIMAMPNAKMLKGNHEVMFEFAVKTGRTDLWFWNGGEPTYNAYQNLPQKQREEMIKFIESLPINIDIEVNGVKYKLVHGSPSEWYHELRNDCGSEAEYAVWERMDLFHAAECDYVTIFGHTPTTYYQNDHIASIWYGKNAIGIDCGSGFKSNKKRVYRLGCLRLDDMTEFYSDEGYDSL